MGDQDDDLDNLVSELNLTAAPAATRLAADPSPNVETWLGRVRELDGSDLLLVAGAPPMISVMRMAWSRYRISMWPVASSKTSTVLRAGARRLCRSS